MKTTDGGPAFPRSSQGPAGDIDMAFGMSLRDWFAGMAMCGIQSSCHAGYPKPDVVAERAYEQADAMLAQRARVTSDKTCTTFKDPL